MVVVYERSGSAHVFVQFFLPGDNKAFSRIPSWNSSAEAVRREITNSPCRDERCGKVEEGIYRLQI